MVDGLGPELLDRAIAAGRAPTMAKLAAAGDRRDDCVSTFPSLTPVCLSALLTGEHPVGSHIPGMTWYHRGERRLVEYGSSFAATLAEGTRQMVDDILVNLNLVHLSPRATTIFESLEDAGYVTAGVNTYVCRGRVRHPITRPVARRLARRIGIVDAVYGPRRYFLGDLFFTDLTGAPRNFGGGIDRHGGAVGRWLVTRDGFDFLFFYLYETDAAQHRAGDVMGAVEGADRGLGLLVEAAGGLERFLDRYAVIVVADHSQSPVLQAADAAAPLDGRGALPVQPPLRPRPLRAGRDRVEPGGDGLPARPRPGVGRRGSPQRMLEQPAAELAMHSRRRLDVVRRGGGELRFRRGPGEADARGNRFTVEGDADLLHPQLHPNALERIEGALTCPTAGDVIVSAAPGWEFADSGGAHHVGGGSHGSLRAEDSLVPLITAGFERRPAAGRPAVDHRPGAARRRATSVCRGRAPGGVRARRRPIASAGYGGGPSRVRRGPRPGTRAQDSISPSAVPHNWMQVLRYCVVGATGYVVNLAAFLIADRRMPYTLAFVLAFVLAATSNFVWNRVWTFRVRHGVPHHQYVRFLTVSAMALCLDLVVLRALVEAGGMAKVSAAAIAILVATPVSFLGNKLWTFQ